MVARPYLVVGPGRRRNATHLEAGVVVAMRKGPTIAPASGEVEGACPSGCDSEPGGGLVQSASPTADGVVVLRILAGLRNSRSAHMRQPIVPCNAQNRSAMSQPYCSD
jgi:hypothetical protein